MIRSSVGRYLRFSILATTLVISLPLLGALFLYSVANDQIGWAVGALAAAGLCVAVAVFGALLWKRRPESADISFGELMLWRFVLRVRAEERLNESAHALGLDLGGRPLRRTQMSAAERLGTLRTLAKALESKDPYTHGHSHRVEVLAAKTAIELGLTLREIEELRTAASLHDVGKIRVPTRILRKPDILTVDEKLVVQEHSTVGAWMVSGVSNRRVVMSVRHHHERWDGNGYPDGIAGRDIPLFARIISVADSFDAMTSDRPYRSGRSRDEAREELRREAGRQFDPVVVDAFLEVLPRRITVPGFFAPGVGAASLRRLLRWVRRGISTQAAETVAGAGIAAVVAASVFLPPSATSSQAAMNGAEAAEVGAPGFDTNVAGASAGDHGKQPNKKDAGEAKDKKRSLRLAAGDAGGKGELLSSRAPTSGVTGGGGSPTDRPHGPSGRPSTADRSGGDDPGPGPVPEPPAPVKKTHTDPQPGRGRDCVDHPGQGGGGGNAKHCGT